MLPKDSLVSKDGVEVDLERLRKECSVESFKIRLEQKQSLSFRKIEQIEDH